jgi:hypothetical protein
MTDAERIAEAALAKVMDHLRDLGKYGPEYARRYTEAVLSGQRGSPRESLLHRDLEHLVREEIQDELAFERRKRPYVA